MEIRARRAMAPALLAAVLLLLAGWRATPARAMSTDPELIAESVTEDGYYVDSAARYLRSDADLDRLRAALARSGKTGVVVLPAGASAGPVLTRLLHAPNRKATYVVLAGTRLQAASNDLPKTTLQRLVTRAEAANDPTKRVLNFLDLLGSARHTPQGSKTARKAGNVSGVTPTAEESQPTADDTTAAPAATAAKKESGGGNGLLYTMGGALVVVVVALGGFLFWRRRSGSSGGAASTM
jgi:hypothetical protein